MKKLIGLLVGFSCFVSACTAGTHQARTPQTASVETSTTTPVEMNTPSPGSPTPSPSQTASITPSSAPTTIPSSTAASKPVLSICSPLEGVSLAQIPSIATNRFQAPLPGNDDGHHGVDLAYYSFGDRKDILGSRIYAVMSGTVSNVTLKRPPYGNMIIIETPLDNIPATWLGSLPLPTPAPTISASPRLSCPNIASSRPWSRDKQSLYLLYAHMNQSPVLKVGDHTACGETVGEVGNTGNSGNPHLHLEARIGPSGVTFTSIAHYDTQATLQEMDNYCEWRISGWFQLIDPLRILTNQ